MGEVERVVLRDLDIGNAGQVDFEGAPRRQHAFGEQCLGLLDGHGTVHLPALVVLCDLGQE